VQGMFNVVEDALSRINESPSSELYTGGDEEEYSVAVAVNVVGTVTRPMLSKSWCRSCRGPTRRIRNSERTLKIMKKVDSRSQ
jgi:hypothetical protein